MATATTTKKTATDTTITGSVKKSETDSRIVEDSRIIEQANKIAELNTKQNSDTNNIRGLKQDITALKIEDNHIFDII